MQEVPDKLITAYLEGSLDQAQAEELSQWVLASKENARYLASLAALEQGLIKNSKLQSNRDILAELNDAEGPTLDEPALPQIEWTYQSESTPRSKALGVLGYVGRQVLRRYAVGAAGVAAVLVFAVLLVFVLRGMGGDPVDPAVVIDGPPAVTHRPPVVIDERPVEPEVDQPIETPVEPVRPVVATLTADRDAVWAGLEAPLGSQLRAGDRLTLTEGFAEITTVRGAVALFEAPASIELSHSNNAVQLHAGKMVGLCQTQSSKGFVVRTPHMDVTDLGTRFGVEVMDSMTTQVHVFDGEVQVRHPHAPVDAEPTHLAAGQSAGLSAETGKIVAIEQDTDRYAGLLPRTIPLQGTGQRLSARQVDPNWQIVAIAGQPMDKPLAVRVFNNPMLTRSVPNDPESAQWIGMRPAQNPAPGSGITYRFQTRVSLPETMDPERAMLVLSYSADDYLRAIVVNGERREVDLPTEKGWAIRDLVINEHFVAGENTIAFEIENHRLADQPNAGPVAFYLRWAWQESALPRSSRAADGALSIQPEPIVKVTGDPAGSSQREGGSMNPI
ncbi:MAG: FecR domain-containing protein [Planctomycetota bacterium]